MVPVAECPHRKRFVEAAYLKTPGASRNDYHVCQDCGASASQIWPPKNGAASQLETAPTPSGDSGAVSKPARKPKPKLETTPQKAPSFSGDSRAVSRSRVYEKPKALITPQEIKQVDLAVSCAVLVLNFNKPPNIRQILSEDVLAAKLTQEQKDAIKTSAQLMDCDERTAIDRHDAVTRQAIRKWSYQAISCGDGACFIPISLLETVMEYLAARKAERLQYIAEYLEVYPTLLADAEKKFQPLGLFNEANFPPVQQVEKQFSMRWRWLEFSASSSLKSVSEEMYKEEFEKVRKDLEEQIVEIRVSLRSMFARLIKNLSTIAGNPDRKIVPRNGTWGGQMLEFIELYESKNVTNDRELTALVEDCRRLLVGLSPDQLRDDAEFRRDVADSLAAIESQTELMAESAANYRRYRLD